MTLIFLHIPKAAGTTLHRIIERQYPSSQIFSFGADSSASLAQFNNLSLKKKRQIEVVKGHFNFGMHETLPWDSTYFTLLRHPVERTISYYNFVLQNQGHFFHDRVKAGNLTVAQVLDQGLTRDLDNGQLRLISGVWNDVPIGGCTEDMLKQAKRNLRDHFAVVGLARKFDESLLMLQQAFGWYHIFYIKHNVAKKRPSSQPLDKKTVAAIKRANSLDIALHDYATELFEERVASFGKPFQLKVRIFQQMNKAYGRYHHMRSHTGRVK